ncbi:MAG TPA: HD domain-containing phosphohydrolase [Bdellovibrionales bacterium]|nr:HD domain-containing phosphohydrolase [Bdellovibrionales bacterium]
MANSEKHEIDPGSMVAIPIAEFLSAAKLPVDIFIKLSESKFVHLAKAGEAVQIERLSRYENKNIEFLFIRKDDYGTYVEQNLTIAGILLNKKELAQGQRTSVLGQATRSVFRELEAVGFTPVTLVHAKTIVKSTVELVEAKMSLASLIESMKNSSEELVAHSSAVSVVSVMIAHAMGWENKSTLEKLALGGLLHDIGLKELAPELLKKPRAEMTFEEIQQYETHSFRGMQILQSLGIVPDDVISMVYEHHENAAGQGFPRRLKDVRVHPLARVIQLANAFVELTIKNVNNPVPRSAEEALQYVEQTMGMPFNREVFKALKKMVEPPGAQNLKAAA